MIEVTVSQPPTFFTSSSSRYTSSVFVADNDSSSTLPPSSTPDGIAFPSSKPSFSVVSSFATGSRDSSTGSMYASLGGELGSVAEVFLAGEIMVGGEDDSVVDEAAAVTFGVGGEDCGKSSLVSPPSSPPVPISLSTSTGNDAVSVSFIASEVTLFLVRCTSMLIAPASLSASFAVPASTATDVVSVAFVRSGPESILEGGLSASFGDVSSNSLLLAEPYKPGGFIVVKSMVRVGSIMSPHTNSLVVFLIPLISDSSLSTISCNSS
mmetsp:Transcript_1910/g.4201  ORF Transcript_1910/g.4201 Transcript_1910/m.4201 type:complete len:266 (+) Transcript_1910:313-1110(+)